MCVRVSDDPLVNRIEAIEAAIRALEPGQQSALAIELASLVEPFAGVSPQGQPQGGLSLTAAAIRAAATMAEVDRARHVLWSTPELQNDAEPEGLSWFSLSATITWIYAADGRSTAPTDGAVNAFKRVADLLDAADQKLGNTGLVDCLLDDVEAGAYSTQVALGADLRARVHQAAARLASTP